MRKIIVVLVALVQVSFVHAQYNPLQPPNTFQHYDNPYYWKNKKPHSAYWQQDVAYQIKAALDDQQHKLNGTMELDYTNNSPDSLTYLVFHLYQNAFDSGSYASAFNERSLPKGFSDFQHISTADWTVNDRAVSTELDNTILFVRLNDPLLPGETVNIACRFTTKFGGIHGRMKRYNAWGYDHYNVVHWYPRISVYDASFGWTTDQHLGHEFYGDFGAFDVTLDLPAHYILDGTGFLLNRSEVLPADLMEKLAIENFKDKPWNEPPSEIIPKTEARKVWKFHAENVHDFAWTADPTYRIGAEKVVLENGHEVTCYALAQEPHASGWQNAASYTAEVISLFSKDFGPYAYHKMIVADARDGMEYPMLTLDGGRDPGYRSLLAHEVGHNWFFGMVGNNETYRAALDEGFTQFLTAWAMTHLEGDSSEQSVSVLGIEKPFKEYRSQRDLSVYDGYYFSSIIRDDSPCLNTHSDRFDSRSQYGQVYYKTATMLYNLQYVLGDELFGKAMRNYFNEWKFSHPYFDDFRRSIIQYTDVDLNWFFDQWLETSETVDYKLKKIKHLGDQRYQLTLKRKGMAMPIDLQVKDKQGNTYDFLIPNTYFVKETEATVLDKWYGWKEFNPTYEAEVQLDGKLSSAQIDPSGRLADVYQLDNHSKTPMSLELNDFQWTRPNQAYEMEWNPLLWYNGFDGFKFGLQLQGQYASVYHLLDLKLWFNSQLLNQDITSPIAEYNRVNYALTYTDPLRGISDDLSYTWHSRWLDGLFTNSFEINKALPNEKTAVSFSFEGLYRPGTSPTDYLILPQYWIADRWNNFTEIGLTHRYRYGKQSVGTIGSNLRSPFFFSDYSYGFLNLDVVNENRFGGLNWRTRVFGQWGMGQEWAPESRLFAAGANPEAWMDDPLVRSRGFVPDELLVSGNAYGVSTGNLQVGGGLNLRGYNNYLLPEINSDSLLRFGVSGQSGVAFNTELEFDDLISILPRYKRFIELKTYAFADAGIININRDNEPLEWSNIRADAGLGAALEIKRWGWLSDLKPVCIRADFPLFLNRPPAGEEFIAFRWLLGIQRAF